MGPETTGASDPPCGWSWSRPRRPDACNFHIIRDGSTPGASDPPLEPIPVCRCIRPRTRSHACAHVCTQRWLVAHGAVGPWWYVIRRGTLSAVAYHLGLTSHMHWVGPRWYGIRGCSYHLGPTPPIFTGWAPGGTVSAVARTTCGPFPPY